MRSIVSFLRHTLLCTTLGFAGLAFGQVESANGLAQLKTFVEGMRSAQGEFTQRTVPVERAAGAARSGVRMSSGRFVFARPGRFRWEVQRPDEQLIVSDGRQVWFYDRDLEQVTVRSLGDAMGSSPAAILFGSDALEREFTLRDMGQREGLYWVEATPIRRDAGFERIAIGLRDNLPAAMEIRDSFGQQTRLTFEAIRRDVQTDPSRFKFVPPAGVDVLRP